MPLSKLQKYILRQGLESSKHQVFKKILLEFYLLQKNKPKPADQISIITKSIERLIERGLVKGYGIKTAEKWYIEKVVLMAPGIREARKLFGRQQSLPLKIVKKVRNPN